MPSEKRKRPTTTAMEVSSPPAKVKKTAAKTKASYTTAQKNAIADFVAFTSSDKTTAAKILRQHGWNIETAANAFFSGGGSGSTGSSSASKSALNKLFDKYRDDAQKPDEINIAGTEPPTVGTEALFQDVGVSIEDVSLLIFSEMVKSPSLGTLTRNEFVEGLATIGASDLKKIAEVVQQRRSQLNEPSFRPTFKSIYKHTFPLARAPGQKGVALESATEFWRVLLQAPSFSWSTPNTPWLDWWLEFLNAKYNKSVNKDMWDQTLLFAEQSMKDESLSFWSEDSSWPGVIDEFVEYVKTEKRSGQDGGDAMDVE